MNYVIIGNGVAGTTAAYSIRKTDKSGTITILTDESIPFYSRIRLIDYLAGGIDKEVLIIYRDTWYRENNINLLLNTPVTDTDKERKLISTSKGETLHYDKLNPSL
jgi:nitrite reductase (NADH) large subunit